MKRNIKNGQSITYSIFNGNKLNNNDVQSIINYSNAIKIGIKPSEAFRNNLLGCSVAAKQYVVNSIKAGQTTEEMISGLSKAPKTISAAAVGMKALATAGSMVAMWAISKAVSGIYNLTQEDKNLKESAKELGSELSLITSNIEDYKQKIDELNTIINDSSSSYDDSMQARKDLMLIQDELIEKYGTEKNAIENITAAISGQSDALNSLGKNEYYKAKNQYNKETAGDKIEYIRNRVNDFVSYGDFNATADTESSHMDKLISKMRFSSYKLKATGNDQLDHLIAGTYNLDINDADFFSDGFSGKYFSINGTLEEIHEKMYGIQEMASKFQVSSQFEKSFTQISNDVDDSLTKNKELYDQHILWEKILTNNPQNQYDDQFNSVNIAKENLNKASLSGDSGRIKEATDNYAKTVNDSINLALKNNDADVADYFRNMYPELQKIVSEWQFNFDFEPNTDGLKDNITDALDKIDGTHDRKNEFSVEDLQEFNPETATEEQTEAYAALKNIAEQQYHMSINELILLLQEKGLIQPENYLKLIEQFGQDNVDKIAPEDFVYAYKIEDIGNITFEELQSEIQKMKNSFNETANVSFSEAWDSISVDSSLTSKLFDLASSGELTGKKLKELADNNTVLKSAMDSTALSANKFAESISELNIKNIDSDINVLTNSLTKLKNGQTLSLEDASKLIAIDNSLAGSVKKVGDGYKIEEDALNGVIDKQKEKYNAAVTNEINETQNTIERIKNRIDGYKTEIKALKEVISSRDSIGGTASGSYSDTLAMIELQKKRRKTKKRLNKNNKKLEGLLDSLNNTSSNPKDTTKDKTQSTAKIFNWIETRISRLERRISKATSKAEDSYRSFEKRAKSYSRAIKLTTDEIKAQEKAAEKYSKKAKKSGLSDNLKKKVRNGTLDIQKIKDKKTQKQVEKYQENWEKKLAAEDEADNLRQKKKQYRRDKIELDITELQAANKSLESENNLISENIEHSKERGQFDLSGNYKQQIANNQKQVGNIEEQNKNLEKLKKTVAEGSEAWNGYESRIQSNNESINSLKNSNAELAEAMYNLPIEERDSLLEEYDSKDELLNAKSENALSAGEKNQYSDEIIANIKSRQSVRQNAVEGTKNNVLSNIPAGGGNDVYDKIQSCISSGQPIGKDLISAVSGSPGLYYACKAYNEALLDKMLYDETAKADTQSQLSSQRDNIESSANEQLESISADETKLQADISKSEAAGLSQSKAQYTEQIRLSKERAQILQNEHNELENWLSDMMAAGEIVKGDKQYEETQNKLKNMDAEIVNCIADQIKFGTEIKEMDLSRLEKLASLLDVAKNRLAGLASLAEAHGHNASDDLIAEQIETSITDAKNYKDMMQEYREQLLDPENLSEWGISEDLMNKVMALVDKGNVNGAKDLLKDNGIDIENLAGFQEYMNGLASATSSCYSAMVEGEKHYDSLYQNRIDKLSEYLDGLQKEKDLKDRTLALEKARFALEKAKNNLTKKVWNGSQWVYTADTEAVQSAQEAYDNTAFDELTHSIQDAIEVLEKLMKSDNLYDDNGNLIKNPDAGSLVKTADDNYVSLTSAQQNNIPQSAMPVPQLNIQNTAVPDFTLPAASGAGAVHVDKVDIILPNINDNSKAYDLAMSLRNELMSLRTYSQQYNWNQ